METIEVDDANCKSHLGVHRRQDGLTTKGWEEQIHSVLPTHFPSFPLHRSPPSLPYIYSSCTSLMLDTSQSYLPLRRGSSDDDFEQPPTLEKQQRSPPKWKDILLVLSGVTNVAALFLILSYLFFSSSPSTRDCPATEYPQTSYSKQNMPLR